MKELRVGCVGGFGHAVCVFDELLGNASINAHAVGVAAAYVGEDTECFRAHPWLAGASYYESVESLLSDARLDVLIVSTRPDRIMPAALLGLEAGCHLIVEKPVALDIASVTRIQAEAMRRRLNVMAMLSMRAQPAFRLAKDLVSAGKIGRPCLINTRKSYKWGKRPEWFNDSAKYGGTWPWIGIHNLDIAHFITNSRPVLASAMHMNQVHPEMSLCEDVAGGFFRMENGALLTASLDLCRPASALSWGDDWVRIVGSEGVLEANGSTGIVEYCSNAEAVVTQSAGVEPARIYSPFFEGIRRGEFFNDTTAFDLTRAALTARESAKQNRMLSINYD